VIRQRPPASADDAGGHLFLGERLSLKDTVPVALSLVGLIMLTQHSTTRGSLLGIA
jgi:drug/metabolite transporter (DMT)-like permease